jgi:hypothetical protein
MDTTQPHYENHCWTGTALYLFSNAAAFWTAVGRTESYKRDTYSMCKTSRGELASINVQRRAGVAELVKNTIVKKWSFGEYFEIFYH